MGGSVTRPVRLPTSSAIRATELVSIPIGVGPWEWSVPTAMTTVSDRLNASSASFQDISSSRCFGNAHLLVRRGRSGVSLVRGPVPATWSFDHRRQSPPAAPRCARCRLSRTVPPLRFLTQAQVRRHELACVRAQPLQDLPPPLPGADGPLPPGPLGSTVVTSLN